MKDNQTDIIIIGAGACGLMVARELAKAGKNVMLLEARDRIGGRIWTLPEIDFGYSAQAGAEFVHGDAPVTKSLIAEAGLTYEETDGEQWSVRNGELTKSTDGPTAEKIYLDHKDMLHEKLSGLKTDIPVATFLEINFSEEKYADLRNWITKMVEGYEAADPKRMSTFALREDWLEGQEWKQGKIKEGYGALLDFLESECKKYGVSMQLNKQVQSIKITSNGVSVISADGSMHGAEKVVVTLPLPLLQSIQFVPTIPEKLVAASQIGFGRVIKCILKFKSRWWVDALGQDFGHMGFMLTDGEVEAWWTQYPEIQPVLTGWIACTTKEVFQQASADEIIQLGLSSLSETFKVSKEFLQEELIIARVFNWQNDVFAQGVYSYATPEAEKSRLELTQSVENKIFFAGEALSKEAASTVEGAFESGKEIAEKILHTL